MRLSKERIHHMAEALLHRLEQQEALELTGDRRELRAVVEQAITNELAVEDRLNAEVRQLLKAYEREIEQGKVDYQKMFTMIKSKLVKDRGLIL